jgi:hypothetical protein
VIGGGLLTVRVRDFRRGASGNECIAVVGGMLSQREEMVFPLRRDMVVPLHCFLFERSCDLTEWGEMWLFALSHSI